MNEHSSVMEVDDGTWAGVPGAIRDANASLAAEWDAVFGPLQRGVADDLMVVGQLGQSLDGRIATENGHSHFINGAEGIAHLHRLRAVCDAVVVGIGTATADDPQLTVRHVAGPNPVRVVIDPRGRLPAAAKVLRDDGVRRLVVVGRDARIDLPAAIEIVRLQHESNGIPPEDILAALAARGLRRILIEGGANTVSRFLTAGCLDRLHVIVAPMIIGTGKPGFILPPIERVDGALRPPMHIHRLGGEVLFDCDFSAQRRPVGRAKTST